MEDSTEYELEELENQPIYGDDWTQISQKQLYKWKRECKQRSLGHEYQMYIHKTRYLVVKCGITLFAVITAMLVTFHERYAYRGLADASIFTTAIVSLLTGLDFLVSPQEKYLGHKMAKSSYDHVIRTIDYITTLPPKKRSDVEVAFVIVTGEMFNIDTTAPPARLPKLRARVPKFDDLGYRPIKAT